MSLKWSTIHAIKVPLGEMKKGERKQEKKIEKMMVEKSSKWFHIFQV